MPPFLRALLVSFGLAVVLVTNWLANALPINGITTGEVSDGFPVLFKPAGYAFAIWGLIYLGLVAFAVFHFLPAGRRSEAGPRLTAPFLVSCAANALWLVAWHHERFVVTLGLMVLLLGSLITLYRRLDPARPAAPATERWMVHVPMSLYLSWICVATIANASITFYDMGWQNGLSEALAIVLVLVAGALSVSVAAPRRDLAFAGVTVWALVAVGVGQAAIPALAWTAFGTAAIVGGMVGWTRAMGWRNRKETIRR